MSIWNTSSAAVRPHACHRRLARQLSGLVAAGLVAAGLVATATPARAAGDLDESSLLTEVPIVLSGTRLLQPLSETPGAVTVIDRDMIRLSGAREIPEVLRLVPGFQVASAGAFPVVTYHGLTGRTNDSSNRLQVLVDGRSLFGQGGAGSVDWSMVRVPLQEIDRIEVFRGSNSAGYGANAALGVINIITRHSSQSHGSYASITRGGRGTDDVSLRQGGGNELLDWRLNYDRVGDRGFGPNYLTINGQSVRSQAYNPRDIDTFSARGDFKLGTHSELRLQGGHTLGKIGDGANANVLNPERLDQVSANHGQLQWRWTRSADEELSVSAYQQDYRHESKIPASVGPYQGVWDTARASSSRELELLHTLRLNPASRLAWGLSSRAETGTSAFYLGTPNAIRTQLDRVFGNLEARLSPTVLANLGANLERSSFGGNTAAPRAMLNVDVAPGQTLRAGVSTAYRNPSIWEHRADNRVTYGPYLLDYAVYSDGRVLPERIQAREISWFGDFREHGLTVDARLYDELINRFVANGVAPTPPGFPELADPSHTVSTFRNGDRIRAQGLEYQLDWKPRAGTRLIFNQAFIHIDSHIGIAASNPAAFDQQASRSAPKHQLSMLLGQTLAHGSEASLMFLRVTSTQWLNSTFESPAYSRMDARLAWPLALGPARTTAAVTLQAIGGSYLDVWNSQRFDRRALFTLSTRL